MIHNLSKNITTFFKKKLLIKNEEIEIFCYGMEIIISTIIGFSFILIVSGVLGDIIFGVYYLIFIVPIRMCVGGYHAKSYFRCNLLFTAFFVAALISYQNMFLYALKILGIINLFSIILIIRWAPLENKNKVISIKNKFKNKCISSFVYLVGSIIGILWSEIYWVEILTIVLNVVTVLLIMGKGVEIYEKNRYKLFV